jgi:queuine tRNA-ribosyltransferase
MKFCLDITKDKNEKKNGWARLGIIHTAHGDIHTPCFMPVGTVATMKAMHFDQLRDAGAEIMLCNTYHLMLQNRYKIIYEMGGLHKFMNWNKPILTDCGGFQAMSLGKINKITEDGCIFRSHISGEKHNLTPEFSMDIQYKLDSTITMALDECVRADINLPSPEYMKKSMERSLRWSKRSKDAFIKRDGYALYGIVQGGEDQDLRKASIEGLKEIDFDGYAIGGDLAVHNNWKLMCNILDFLMPLTPWDKPRYEMGIGKPIDIVVSVLRGIDQFDCVMPARSGRNGQAWTKDGPINIKNAKYIYDNSPIEKECNCRACKQHTKSYLHHLFKANEILGMMLLTEHNIMYYQNLMQEIREAIREERYIEYVDEFIKKHQKTDGI